MTPARDPKQVLRSRTQGPWLGTSQSNVSALFWQVFGRGTGPKRSEMAVGFIWVDSRGLATILDPFRAILVILGPTPYLRRQQSELLGQDISLLFQQRRCVLLKQDRCVLLKQDRCVLLKQDRSVLLKQDRCLLLRQDRCLSSRHLSCLNRRHLSCLNRRHNSSRPEAGSCRVFC